jgi:hypothetical protein
MWKVVTSDTGAFCQENKAAVKPEQRPAMMGARTVHKHSHLKGHLFKLGLIYSPRCERCLENGEPTTHILCNYEAIAYLKFGHHGT